MIFILIFWIFLSLLVGTFGSSKSIGFWVSFIVSLIFSPIIGFLCCIFSKDESNQVHPYVKYLDIAERENEKGNLSLARDNFIEAKFYLNKYGYSSDKAKQT